jgi:hypothetical protein
MTSSVVVWNDFGDAFASQARVHRVVIMEVAGVGVVDVDAVVVFEAKGQSW